MLEEGHQAEYGTHEELLEADGIYADIYRRQQLEKQLEQEGGAEDEGIQ